MTPEQILADAESRLARHATNMAELLDGMESEDWGVYVESEELFLAYPTRCTWLSPDTFRIYLAEGTTVSISTSTFGTGMTFAS